MSAASEFPPLVHIPEQARRSGVGSPLVKRPRGHLSLVDGSAPAAVPPLARIKQVAPPAELCREEIRPAAPPTPLRLTRRGVLALWVAAALVSITVLLLAYASHQWAPGDPPAASGPQVATSVTVRSGDSLWSIAARVAPRSDPRQVVDRLRQLNHLSSVQLTPGQTLKLR